MDHILSLPLGPASWTLPWAVFSPTGIRVKTNKATLASLLQRNVHTIEQSSFSKHCCSNRWYSPCAEFKRRSVVVWCCSCSPTLYGVTRGVWCRSVNFSACACLKWKNQNFRCATSLAVAGGGEQAGMLRYQHFTDMCGFKGYLFFCLFWSKLGDRFLVSNRVWFCSDWC